jgi:hypothetical protein
MMVWSEKIGPYLEKAFICLDNALQSQISDFQYRIEIGLLSNFDRYCARMVRGVRTN